MQKIIYPLLFTLSLNTYAQDTLYISSPSEGLGEAVISASRTAEVRKDVAQQIRVITKADIQNTNASTTAELLQTTGLAAVQKSQLGGGSPVLRGFEANRVLLVVDGVRQNNLIFRSGHLQNIISLDANAMQRIEVLYGGGATMYGSDAMGGVINVQTMEPTPPAPTPPAPRRGETVGLLPVAPVKGDTPSVSPLRGAGGVRYGSAANEKTINATVNISAHPSSVSPLRGVGGLLSITASSFGDLRKGTNNQFGYAGFGDCTQYVQRINGTDSIVQNTDPNVQVGTAYSQFDALQKIKYSPNQRHSHTLNLQFSTSTDIPRYDRLQTFTAGKPRFAEWYYGPQRRFMGAYHYENKYGRYWDKLNTIIAFQNIEESRHSRRFLNKNIQRQFENVQILSLNLDAVKALSPSDTKLHYGAEAFLQQNQSIAYSQDITNSSLATSPLGARYPNARMNTFALYANILGKIDLPRSNKTLSQMMGVRLTANSLTAKFNDFALNADTKYTETNQQNLSFDYRYDASWQIDNNFRIATTVSSAFRTPNVDDFGKTFEQTNNTIILPNPTLQPEKMIQGDLTFEYNNNKGTIASITGFISFLDNGIAVKAKPFNGQDSVTYNGLRYQALANVNIAESRRSGASINFKTPLFKSLSANGNITYTYGYDKTNNVPLDHIPPVYGVFGLNYQQKRWSAEAFALFNGWKHTWEYSPTGEDNPDKATADGSFAWYTLNLRGHYTINSHFKLQLTVENLLDANYRTFASGLSGAGRNIVGTLRYNF